MGILHRLLSVSVGVAAGTLAYKLLKDYNDKNLIEGEYVTLPVEADAQPAPQGNSEPAIGQEPQPAPQKAAQKPDNGPNVNPVTLGTAEKPIMENGKLDPLRIACAEDFGEWDDMGCQG